MVSELFVVRGETDGASTEGTFELDSDIFYDRVSFIRIPKGMKAKVWFKKLAGDGETTVALEFTNDVTAETPSWKALENEKLASSGEVALEKRRPVILRGRTGKEAFRLRWSQPTATKAYVELGVEFDEE